MKYTLLFSATLLFASFINAFGQSTNRDTILQPPSRYTPQPPPPFVFADTSTFRLHRDTGDFFLQNLKNSRIYHIAKDWLIPPDSLKDYDSSIFDYDSVATAFLLGENLVGIHLSSYDISDGGSMALAQGLDVFLALDTVAHKVLPDVLHLGITKQRWKAMGFFEAEYTHFLVGKVGSPYFTLGMFQEKIGMHWDNEKGVPGKGPFYEQTPIRWYVFDGKKWSYEKSLDKRWPMGGCGELPLVGILITPVEVAKEEYRMRRF